MNCLDQSPTSLFYQKERVVKARLSNDLTPNDLLNPHQSAYCKHHSTEIALLYIHDHRINFMSLPSWSTGCLRYHRPQYLTRLSSWFGIQGTALNWLGPICPLAIFVSNATTTSPLNTLVSVVFPRFSSWPYSLSCIQSHSVLSSHLCP